MMTREEAKDKISIRSEETYPYRVVDNVNEVIDEIFDQQDKLEAELKAKDEQLVQTEAGYKEAVKEVEALDLAHKAKDECIANLSAERDKYNTIAANLQISRQKAYDNIAELEAIIEKMKCCENCKSYTNVGSNCLLDMDDSLDCKANNYLNWKLKGNE